MNNREDVLKRILLNMKYDSSKTLSENTINLDELIVEQVSSDEQKTKAKICGHNSWEAYKNSNWKCTTNQLTNPTAIKNFQEWYLTKKEKAKSNSNGLYTTKLCSKPCVKDVAVDGKLGENTKKLWNEHFFEYKTLINKPLVNPNLPIKIDFNQLEAENKKNELLNKVDEKTKEYLSKVFRFTIQNPSGWNYGKIPKAITPKLSKLAKFQADEVPYYKGWNSTFDGIFPTPRKYTQDELKVLYNATGGDKLYKEKLKQKAVEDVKLQNKFDLYDKTTVKSDRLGYDRYVGQTGLTRKQEDIKSQEDYWEEKLEPYKNKIYDGAVEWNKYLDKVNKELQTKCSRPIKFCSKVDINGTMRETSNCVYLSYSDICNNAGGIWVYNVGENNAWCGCRSMNDPELANTSNTSSSLIQFNGPEGPITANITFGQILPYNTPETGGKDVKVREDAHSVLGAIELGLFAAAFVSGPFAPLFFGAAAAVGFADGVKYYQEGDTHMGVMMMALSMLGVGEVAAAFKMAKNGVAAAKLVEEYGVTGIKRLAKDALDPNIVLSATHKANLKIIKESVYHSQKILGKEMSEKFFKNFTENIVSVAKKQKWGWKEFAKIFYDFETMSPTFKGFLIYFGGVPYTIDQIYLALYGNDNDRQRSMIGDLFNYLNKYPGEKEKALNEAWLKFQSLLVAEPTLMKIQQKLISKTTEAMDGSWSFDKTVSDEELIKKARRERKIIDGYNQKSVDASIEDGEKEAREKEGCEKYNSLKNLGWVEITKIESTKEKAKGTQLDMLEKLECGGTKYMLNKQNSDIEKIYPKTMSGQAPIYKTMIDNPNL